MDQLVSLSDFWDILRGRAGKYNRSYIVLKIVNTLDRISSTRSMILPLTAENRSRVLEGTCVITILAIDLKHIYSKNSSIPESLNSQIPKFLNL